MLRWRYSHYRLLIRKLPRTSQQQIRCTLFRFTTIPFLAIMRARIWRIRMLSIQCWKVLLQGLLFLSFLRHSRLHKLRLWLGRLRFRLSNQIPCITESHIYLDSLDIMCTVSLGFMCRQTSSFSISMARRLLILRLNLKTFVICRESTFLTIHF